MLNSLFHRLFPPASNTSDFALSYQVLPLDGQSIYVVGDLHGSAQLLRQIEAAIAKDMNGKSAHFVLLGDLIDRGPSSADVMDHMLRRPPAGMTRHAILGNHEAMFLRFLANPTMAAEWLNFGGLETLVSYGIDPTAFAALSPKHKRYQIDAHIPAAHRSFLENLPAVLTWGRVIFAHAGFDFSAPIAAQSEDTVLWARAPILPEMVPTGYLFVHGHFPIDWPDVTQAVINLDVGTYITDRGCILRIDPSGTRQLMQI